MAHKLPLNDIRFLADFHAYCRTRGGAEYNYLDASVCALAQFLQASGRIEDEAQPCGLVKYANWNPEPGSSLHGALNAGEDYTFSALATRLEALLADAPVLVTSA